jgi:hypothetical protein
MFSQVKQFDGNFDADVMKFTSVGLPMLTVFAEIFISWLNTNFPDRLAICEVL